jgi:uncharacterized protein (TIGR00304 family)
MNRYFIMALCSGICGIVLLGYSAASGEGSAGVVLFIPFFSGSGIYSFLGALCIMAAIFIGFIGFAASQPGFEDSENNPEKRSGQSSQSGPKKSIKGGGVVMIGPIPIIFGSDSKTAMILVVLAIILMIIVMVFMFYLR